MDKYELVLDIIEHPGNYSAEDLTEILSDPEVRENYNLLCKIDSSIKSEKMSDVNAEWERFSDRYIADKRKTFLWFGSRAASLAALIGTSIVAVAGIAIAVSVFDNKSNADETRVASSVIIETTDGVSGGNDSVKAVVEPVLFEDETLGKILKTVADIYDVEIKFNNKGAETLHLYYKLDPSMPLDEVLEQLNTFERINIRRNGNILNID